MKGSQSNAAPGKAADLDLTAAEDAETGSEPGSAVARAREFYREHADEIIARMRNPTTPTNNIAAEIVLECESNARLRAEAQRAIAAAREAREARNALDSALSSYGRTSLRTERNG